MTNQPTIVMLVPNLMFATRIEDAARSHHVAVISPSDRASFLNALLDGARLVLIDANSLDPAWLDWVTAAKENPASEIVPILAFGSHTDTALRERCLNAGVDRYMARSNFVDGLIRIHRRRRARGHRRAMRRTSAGGRRARPRRIQRRPILRTA